MNIKGKNIQTVLVVGHGRSGTIHLGEMMERHKDVYATIERPRRLFRMLNESIFNPSEWFIIPQIFEAKKRFLENQSIWEDVDKPFWLEKANAMVLIQDLVETFYSEALILHIIRNPFDVYCSAVRHPGLMSWFPRVNEVFGQGDNKFMGTNAAIEANYNNLSLVEKMAYKWKSWVECGLQWQKTSSRIYTLTYEEMARNPGKTFVNIGEFLRLRESPNWLKSVICGTHSRSVNRYKWDMSQGETNKMNGILSDFLNSSDILQQYRLK